ncbi:RNA polymerase sigma factor [Chitinophaga barathri]|uniref:Sigma-70 family RNA polymerase sigma factor n=1 Tax=Chitinophaga barathri TaxID=1647451 RepID=A0A3N4MSD4_9BACT|nr:sigma-70 family RNA polymerase sigma factor [Chitinophaga barathri]RPD43050.1 sigma-70 family RNA polymerase sigma factor [Chitinophaga barathri]
MQNRRNFQEIPPGELNNKELAEALQNSDHEAFTIIFYTLMPRVLAYLTGCVKRRDLAEELTQDTFLKLWHTRTQLPDDVILTAYIFVIARNHLYNFLRRRRLEAAYEAEAASSAYLSENLEPSLEFNEIWRQYQDCLSRLDPEQKEIFILSRDHDLTYEQIAAELGINQRLVKRRMGSTLKILRKELLSLLVSL